MESTSKRGLFKRRPVKRILAMLLAAAMVITMVPELPGMMLEAQAAEPDVVEIACKHGSSDGIVYYLQRQTGSGSGAFPEGGQIIFVPGSSPKPYLTVLPEGSGILKVAPYDREKRGWDEYNSSKINCWVDVVRATDGFDWCKHGTINNSSEYNCWAGGAQHVAGGAYDYSEYPYGSKITVVVKKDGQPWKNATVSLYSGSSKIKDIKAPTTGICDFGYQKNGAYSIYVNGEYSEAVVVDAEPEASDVGEPKKSVDGFYYITNLNFSRTLNYYTLNANYTLNKDKESPVAYGTPGQLEMVFSSETLARSSSGTITKVVKNNTKPYNVIVGGQDTGHNIGHGTSRVNNGSDDDTKKSSETETANFYEMKVTLKADMLMDSSNVTLRDDKGNVKYLLSYSGSPKTNEADYTLILQEELESNTVDTADPTPINVPTKYYIYVDGQFVNEYLWRAGSKKGTVANEIDGWENTEAHPQPYPYENTINFYTVKAKIRQDNATMDQAQIDLDNGKYHYSLERSGSEYVANVLNYKDTQGNEVAYKLTVEGAIDSKVNEVTSSSKAPELDYYSVTYYTYSKSGITYVRNNTPYRKQIVRKGGYTVAPSDPFVDGLSFSWYSSYDWLSTQTLDNKTYASKVAKPEFDYSKTDIKEMTTLYAQFGEPTVSVNDFIRTDANGTIKGDGNSFVVGNLGISGFGTKNTAIKSAEIHVKNISTVKVVSNNYSGISATVTQGMDQNKLSSTNTATDTIINVTFNKGKGASMAQAQEWLRKCLVFTPDYSASDFNDGSSPKPVCKVEVTVSDGILTSGKKDPSEIDPMQNMGGTPKKLRGGVSETLTGGYYYVDSDISYNNGSGSGLYISDGKTVYIYVAKGCTLTVRGANGSGTSYGYAGINVPSNSTLYIVGEGTVYAYGGNAGNGSGGSSNLSNARVYSGKPDTVVSGSGGSGGYGGGGAGAGIGGNGGWGGSYGGGAGNVSAQADKGKSMSNGNRGSDGSGGSNGSAGGTVYIQGSVAVYAYGGSGGSGGSGGTNYRNLSGHNKSNYCANDKGSGWGSSYGGGSGGAGGGGAGGGAGNAIGGGAGGGGGGAGGGSGGTCARNNKNNIQVNEMAHGGGGEGGRAPSGGSGGGNGGGTRSDSSSGRNSSGGYGGSAGSAGSAGWSGTVYSSTSRTTGTYSSVNSAVTYNITFTGAASGGSLKYNLGTTRYVTVPDYNAKTGWYLLGWHLDKYAQNLMGGKSALTSKETTLYQPGEKITIDPTTIGHISFRPVIREKTGISATDSTSMQYEKTKIAAPVTYKKYIIQTSLDGEPYDMGPLVLKSGSEEYVLTAGENAIYSMVLQGNSKTFAVTSTKYPKSYKSGNKLCDVSGVETSSTSVTPIDFESIFIDVYDNDTTDLLLDSRKQGVEDEDIKPGDSVPESTDGPVLTLVETKNGVSKWQHIRQKVVEDITEYDVYIDGVKVISFNDKNNNQAQLAKYGKENKVRVTYSNITVKISGNALVENVEYRADDGSRIVPALTDPASKTNPKTGVWTFNERRIRNANLGDGTYNIYINGMDTGKTAGFDKSYTFNIPFYNLTVTTKLDGKAADIGEVKLDDLQADLPMTRVSEGVYQLLTMSLLRRNIKVNGEIVGSITPPTAQSVDINYYSVNYNPEYDTSEIVEEVTEETTKESTIEKTDKRDQGIYRAGAVTAIKDGSGVVYKPDTTQESTQDPTPKHFGGWSFGGKTYVEGDEYTIPSGKTTFEPVWVDNKYAEARWIIDGVTHFGTLREAIAAVNDVVIVTYGSGQSAVTTTLAAARAAGIDNYKLVSSEGNTVYKDKDGNPVPMTSDVSIIVQNSATLSESSTIPMGTTFTVEKPTDVWISEAIVTEGGTDEAPTYTPDETKTHIGLTPGGKLVIAEGVTLTNYGTAVNEYGMTIQKDGVLLNKYVQKTANNTDTKTGAIFSNTVQTSEPKLVLVPGDGIKQPGRIINEGIYNNTGKADVPKDGFENDGEAEGDGDGGTLGDTKPDNDDPFGGLADIDETKTPHIIKLNGDVTLKDTVIFEKHAYEEGCAWILDLNGHTITGPNNTSYTTSEQAKAAIRVNPEASLTVIDTNGKSVDSVDNTRRGGKIVGGNGVGVYTEESTGKIKAYPGAPGLVIEGGTVTIEAPAAVYGGGGAMGICSAKTTFNSSGEAVTTDGTKQDGGDGGTGAVLANNASLTINYGALVQGGNGGDSITNNTSINSTDVNAAVGYGGNAGNGVSGNGTLTNKGRISTKPEGSEGDENKVNTPATTLRAGKPGSGFIYTPPVIDDEHPNTPITRPQISKPDPEQDGDEGEGIDPGSLDNVENTAEDGWLSPSAEEFTITPSYKVYKEENGNPVEQEPDTISFDIDLNNSGNKTALEFAGEKLTAYKLYDQGTEGAADPVSGNSGYVAGPGIVIVPNNTDSSMFDISLSTGAVVDTNEEIQIWYTTDGTVPEVEVSQGAVVAKSGNTASKYGTTAFNMSNNSGFTIKAIAVRFKTTDSESLITGTSDVSVRKYDSVLVGGTQYVTGRSKTADNAAEINAPTINYDSTTNKVTIVSVSTEAEYTTYYTTDVSAPVYVDWASYDPTAEGAAKWSIYEPGTTDIPVTSATKVRAVTVKKTGESPDTVTTYSKVSVRNCGLSVTDLIGTTEVKYYAINKETGAETPVTKPSAVGTYRVKLTASGATDKTSVDARRPVKDLVIGTFEIIKRGNTTPVSYAPPEGDKPATIGPALNDDETPVTNTYSVTINDNSDGKVTATKIYVEADTDDIKSKIRSVATYDTDPNATGTATKTISLIGTVAANYTATWTVVSPETGVTIANGSGTAGISATGTSNEVMNLSVPDNNTSDIEINVTSAITEPVLAPIVVSAYDITVEEGYSSESISVTSKNPTSKAWTYGDLTCVVSGTNASNGSVVITPGTSETPTTPATPDAFTFTIPTGLTSAGHSEDNPAGVYTYDFAITSHRTDDGATSTVTVPVNVTVIPKTSPATVGGPAVPDPIAPVIEFVKDGSDVKAQFAHGNIYKVTGTYGEETISEVQPGEGESNYTYNKVSSKTDISYMLYYSTNPNAGIPNLSTSTSTPLTMNGWIAGTNTDPVSGESIIVNTDDEPITVTKTYKAVVVKTETVTQKTDTVIQGTKAEAVNYQNAGFWTDATTNESEVYTYTFSTVPTATYKIYKQSGNEQGVTPEQPEPVVGSSNVPAPVITIQVDSEDANKAAATISSNITTVPDGYTLKTYYTLDGTAPTAYSPEYVYEGTGATTISLVKYTHIKAYNVLTKESSTLSSIISARTFVPKDVVKITKNPDPAPGSESIEPIKPGKVTIETDIPKGNPSEDPEKVNVEFEVTEEDDGTLKLSVPTYTIPYGIENFQIVGATEAANVKESGEAASDTTTKYIDIGTGSDAGIISALKVTPATGGDTAKVKITDSTNDLAYIKVIPRPITIRPVNLDFTFGDEKTKASLSGQTVTLDGLTVEDLSATKYAVITGGLADGDELKTVKISVVGKPSGNNVAGLASGDLTDIKYALDKPSIKVLKVGSYVMGVDDKAGTNPATPDVQIVESADNTSDKTNNYIITPQSGALNIHPDTATVVGISAKNKEYDGTNTAALNHTADNDNETTILSGTTVINSNDKVLDSSTSVNDTGSGYTYGSPDAGTQSVSLKNGNDYTYSVDGGNYVAGEDSQDTAYGTITRKSLDGIKIPEGQTDYGKTITGSATVQYNGKFQHPKTLTYSYGETPATIATLTYGTDYTVAGIGYKDVKFKEEGVSPVPDAYKLDITGVGNYKGAGKADFTIVPRDLEDQGNTTTITLEQSHIIYDGAEHEFVIKKVTVKDNTTNDEMILTEGKDYDVVVLDDAESYDSDSGYANRPAGTRSSLGEESGKYKLYIRGKGNFAGTASTEFSIGKKQLPEDYSYQDPNDNTNTIQVSAVKVKAVPATYFNNADQDQVFEVQLRKSAKGITQESDIKYDNPLDPDDYYIKKVEACNFTDESDSSITAVSTVPHPDTTDGKTAQTYYKNNITPYAVVNKIGGYKVTIGFNNYDGEATGVFEVKDGQPEFYIIGVEAEQGGNGVILEGEEAADYIQGQNEEPRPLAEEYAYNDNGENHDDPLHKVKLATRYNTGGQTPTEGGQISFGYAATGDALIKEQAVADISADGVVTFKSAGTVEVMASVTAAETDAGKFQAASDKVTLTVIRKDSEYTMLSKGESIEHWTTSGGTEADPVKTEATDEGTVKTYITSNVYKPTDADDTWEERITSTTTTTIDDSGETPVEKTTEPIITGTEYVIHKTYGDASFTIEPGNLPLYLTDKVTYRSTSDSVSAGSDFLKEVMVVSDNPDVASVTMQKTGDVNNGKAQVTIVGAGTAKLTISTPQTDKYKQALQEITLVVEKKEITANTKSYTKVYDGSTDTVYDEINDLYEDLTFEFDNGALKAGDSIALTGITGNYIDTPGNPGSAKNVGENKTIAITKEQAQKVRFAKPITDNNIVTGYNYDEVKLDPGITEDVIVTESEGNWLINSLADYVVKIPKTSTGHSITKRTAYVTVYAQDKTYDGTPAASLRSKTQDDDGNFAVDADWITAENLVEADAKRGITADTLNINKPEANSLTVEFTDKKAGYKPVDLFAGNTKIYNSTSDIPDDKDNRKGVLLDGASGKVGDSVTATTIGNNDSGITWNWVGTGDNDEEKAASAVTTAANYEVRLITAYANIFPKTVSGIVAIGKDRKYEAGATYAQVKITAPEAAKTDVYSAEPGSGDNSVSIVNYSNKTETQKAEIYSALGIVKEGDPTAFTGVTVQVRDNITGIAAQIEDDAAGRREVFLSLVGGDASNYVLEYPTFYIVVYKDTDKRELKLNISNWTYGSTPSVPSVTLKNTGDPISDSILYQYAPVADNATVESVKSEDEKDSSPYDWTATIPTEVGYYCVKATITSANYAERTLYQIFQIEKASPVNVTREVYYVPASENEIKNLVYDLSDDLWDKKSSLTVDAGSITTGNVVKEGSVSVSRNGIVSYTVKASAEDTRDGIVIDVGETKNINGYTITLDLKTKGISTELPNPNDLGDEEVNDNYLVPYTVIYQKQKLDGTYETDTDKSGEQYAYFGAVVKPVLWEYEGFVTPASGSGRITAFDQVFTYKYVRKVFPTEADLNGGSSAAIPSAIRYGEIFNDVLPKPVRNGYSFDGWKISYTTPDGTAKTLTIDKDGKIISDGPDEGTAATMPDADGVVKIKAKWNEDNSGTEWITVKYVNGVDDSVSTTVYNTPAIPDQRVEKGDVNNSIILADCDDWTYDKHRFAGWSYTSIQAGEGDTTEEVPNTIIKPGQSIAIDPEKVKVDGSAGTTWTVTFTATWDVQYTVKHMQQNLPSSHGSDLGIGENDFTLADTEVFYAPAGTPIQSTPEEGQHSVNPVAKTYQGFKVTADGDQPKYAVTGGDSNDTIHADGNTVITFKYMRQQYKLTKVANYENPTGDYNEDYYFYGEPLPTQSRIGWTFKGWYTSSSGGTPITTMPAADTTAYARWVSGNRKGVAIVVNMPTDNRATGIIIKDIEAETTVSSEDAGVTNKFVLNLRDELQEEAESDIDDYRVGQDKSLILTMTMNIFGDVGEKYYTNGQSKLVEEMKNNAETNFYTSDEGAGNELALDFFDIDINKTVEDTTITTKPVTVTNNVLEFVIGYRMSGNRLMPNVYRGHLTGQKDKEGKDIISVKEFTRLSQKPYVPQDGVVWIEENTDSANLTLHIYSKNFSEFAVSSVKLGSRYYNVAFDAGGGTLRGEKSLTVRSGELIDAAYFTGDMTPARSGYIFAGWLDRNTGKYLTPDAGIETDKDLVAQWTTEGEEPPVNPGGGGGGGGTTPAGPLEGVVITGAGGPNGEPRVGDTLTAETVPAGTPDVTYQWYRDGEPIEGATDPTYVPGEDDTGKKITVKVTQNAGTDEEITVESEPTKEVTANYLSTVTITGCTGIGGAPRVGDTLTAQIVPEGLEGLTYEWLLDGEPISGATGTTYTLTKDDLDKTITVRVTQNKGTDEEITVISDPVGPVKKQPAEAPTLEEIKEKMSIDYQDETVKVADDLEVTLDPTKDEGSDSVSITDILDDDDPDNDVIYVRRKETEDLGPSDWVKVPLDVVRPEGPAGVTTADTSEEEKGTAKVSFTPEDKGKKVVVQYKGEDGIWHEVPGPVTVGEDGSVTIDGLRKGDYDVRVAYAPEEGKLRSKWWTGTVHVEKGIDDEDFIEQLYIIHYIMEYSGKQLSESTEPVYISRVSLYNDGTTYGISANKAFYDKASATLFGDNENLGILSYTIVGKAVYSDGTPVYRSENSTDVIEDTLFTRTSAEFVDNADGIACTDVPVLYNDLYVYANVGAYATDRDADGVVISTPAGVKYSGLKHMLSNDPKALKAGSNKSASYDLTITVTDTKTKNSDGTDYELVFGKDYTVSYKNNVNASVEVSAAAGNTYYKQIWDESQADKKWPQIIVKGKGNYSKMKAVVYFDILPLSIGETYQAVGNYADVVKDSYTLNKKGGVKLTTKPVRYARKYDKLTGGYVTNEAKTIKYKAGTDVTMTLQKLNAEGSWEVFGAGDLTNKKAAKALLKTITEPGTYRVKVTGKGNYYGTVKDTFEVYAFKSTMFSKLKVSKGKPVFTAEGVDASALVTGIKTKVKDANNTKSVIPSEAYTVTLVPVSGGASVSEDGTKALSAGKYTALVTVNDISSLRTAYPVLNIDGPIQVPVTIKAQKLANTMFTTDWSASGEAYDGESRDITVTLNGLTTDEVTIAKQMLVKGKKTYVPLSENELAEAVTADGSTITVSGSYTLDDERTVDNAVPGTYNLVMYGLGKYADSTYTIKYTRNAAELKSEYISVTEAQFNAAGAMTEVTVTEPDGDEIELTGTGNDAYSLRYSNNLTVGTGKVTVMVKDVSTGFRKGSSMAAEFKISAKPVTEVHKYSEYSSELAGELFIKSDATVLKGRKAPKYAIYQASPDGSKLVTVKTTEYAGAYAENSASDETTGKIYDLTLTNGTGANLDFGETGVTVEEVYAEYATKAKILTKQKELSAETVAADATLIRNKGDGRVYTSEDIEEFASGTTPVTIDKKGRITVTYAGGCYILPTINEIKATDAAGQEVTLTLEDGDYTISYVKNNKVGTGKMTLTLTQEAAKKYGIGGTRTYTFKIVRQTSTGLKL